MIKVAVILCGCGRFDGSEIQEAVLSLLHLEKQGADWQAFAPDRAQWSVCEHFEGQPLPGEQRNQLQEAARLARGRVKPLEQAKVVEFDALLLPGGSGAAHNLCDFAERGADAEVDPALAALLRAFHAARKPIGAICIAPALVALVLGEHHPELTLGPANEGPALEAAKCGARMVSCTVEQIHEDPRHRILSTPAYILGPGIADVDRGIGALVRRLVALADEGKA